MLLAGLISVLFLGWWVLAPVCEVYESCRTKIKLGQPKGQVEKTGATLLPYWILSFTFLGFAKFVDWLVYPWGSFGVIAFMIILIGISLPRLVVNFRFVRYWMATQDLSD